MSATTGGFGRTGPARQMRLAEIIAAELRDRILTEPTEWVLPKQDELAVAFSVSGPTIREALRVLESEGLITVRRGKVGGAQVHRPDGASAAKVVGLTLQGERTRMRDLAYAIAVIEPICAATLAEWDERAMHLIPRLEENVTNMAAADRGPVFTHYAREFHEIMSDSVVNPPMRLMLQTLERIWSAQEEAWADQMAQTGHYPDDESRQVVIRAHRRILSHLEKGNSAGIGKAMRDHILATQELVLSQYGDRIIDTASMRSFQSFGSSSRQNSQYGQSTTE